MCVRFVCFLRVMRVEVRKIKIMHGLEAEIQGRIEVGHGLLNSGADREKLKQYSVQPSFLIGINF